MRKMRKVKGEGKYVFLFSFNVSPLKKLLLVKIFMECVALVMLVCMFFYDTSAGQNGPLASILKIFGPETLFV